MSLFGMEWKKWRRHEKILALAERHPLLYRLKLGIIYVRGLFRLAVYFFLVALFFFVFPLTPVCYGIAHGWETFLCALAPFAFFGGISFIYWKLVFRRYDPDGVQLDPERFGRLYDDVRAICRDLRITPIRRIYLDMGVNVRVAPRFPVFKALRRDILIVGYPLVCAMDAKSFRICLARVLCHENRRIARNAALRRIAGEWSLLPKEAFFGCDELERLMRPGIDLALFPLRVRSERAAEQWCVGTFGRGDFAACVTQTQFRLSQFNEEALALNRFSERGPDADRAASVIREEIRKPVPEAEAKRILGRLLRTSEPVDEALPPFRERVGTDDPAALLPYLERTPDAAEHYLFSDPTFEADYNAILKEALVVPSDDDNEDWDEYVYNEGGIKHFVSLKKALKAEAVDESSDDPEAWEKALEAADALGHADRRRELLEKAVKRFPDNLVFQGELIVLRMEDAATAQEEAAAAAELEKITDRLAEQDPVLSAEFHYELYQYAVRLGDAELVKRRLADLRSLKL